MQQSATFAQNSSWADAHFISERSLGLYLQSAGQEDTLKRWESAGRTSPRIPCTTTVDAPWSGGTGAWQVANFLSAEQKRGILLDVEDDGTEGGFTVGRRITDLLMAAAIGSIPVLGQMSWASSCIYKFSFHKKRLLAEKGLAGQPAAVPSAWKASAESLVFASYIITAGRQSRATISGDYPAVHTIHRDWKDRLLDSCLIGRLGRKRIVLLAPDELPSHPEMPWAPDFSCARLRGIQNQPDEEFWTSLEQLAGRCEVTGGAFTLEPGDAIFIPYGWWHAVRPLDEFTVITGLAKVPEMAR
eukprot:TRINITY_DN93998_c0_g1_i1.p1 TRINITY_DN93998_c0_g1~~TRINITY_DN93998_c0_g1_i1.p1  ORF type:complete len:301 (+),score=39.36 TRINITY_DN93998_c0_g1_i1:137-1039(+)